MSSPHISLRKLQHVQRVSELGSFVRAADDLAITQSALTRSVQSIEAQFGIRLFDRDRGGVRLTSVGAALLERAGPLLREAQDIERELKRIGSGEEGDVALGLSPIVAKAALAPLLTSQLRERPAAHVRAYVRSAAPLIALLRAEQIEFCATTIGTIEPTADLIIRPIATISNILAVAAGHPLLARGALALADISGFPLIASTQPIGLEQHFAVQGVRFRPSVVTEDYGSLIEIALNSEAIWLTSPIGCRRELEAGLLRPLPVASDGVLSSTDVGVVSLSRRTMSPLTGALMTEIARLVSDTPIRPPQ